MVSFPRSGHHALVGFLNRFCDFPSQYCEFYNCAKHNDERIDCPSQDLKWNKKQFLCAAGNRILKNHDFKLDLPYHEENRYIIQYRHPFYSIASWYEIEPIKGHKGSSWLEFLDKQLKFWCQFVEKWVINYGGCDDVFLVPYESMASPEIITRIAKFSGFTKLSYNNLRKDYFKSGRQLEDSDGLLKFRELAILGLLKQVGLKPIFY